MQSAGTAKAQHHVSVTQCIKWACKGVAKGARGGRNFCPKHFQAIPWLFWVNSVNPVTNEQVMSWIGGLIQHTIFWLVFAIVVVWNKTVEILLPEVLEQKMYMDTYTCQFYSLQWWVHLLSMFCLMRCTEQVGLSPPYSCLAARPLNHPTPQGLFSCTASSIQHLCLVLAMENILMCSRAVNSWLTYGYWDILTLWKGIFFQRRHWRDTCLKLE